MSKPNRPPKTRRKDRTAAERQRRYRARRAAKVDEAMRFKAASEAQQAAQKSALESVMHRLNEQKQKYTKLQEELQSERANIDQIRKFLNELIGGLSPAARQMAIAKARISGLNTLIE